MDGICTKLKYHSRPIHITPESTCSQRMKNAAPCVVAILPKVPAAPSMIASMTMPAMIVRPSDWKIAPMDASC